MPRINLSFRRRGGSLPLRIFSRRRAFCGGRPPESASALSRVPGARPAASMPPQSRRHPCRRRTSNPQPGYCKAELRHAHHGRRAKRPNGFRGPRREHRHVESSGGASTEVGRGKGPATDNRILCTRPSKEAESSSQAACTAEEKAESSSPAGQHKNGYPRPRARGVAPRKLSNEAVPLLWHAPCPHARRTPRPARTCAAMCGLLPRGGSPPALPPPPASCRRTRPPCRPFHPTRRPPGGLHAASPDLQSHPPRDLPDGTYEGRGGGVFPAHRRTANRGGVPPLPWPKKLRHSLLAQLKQTKHTTSTPKTPLDGRDKPCTL